MRRTILNFRRGFTLVEALVVLGIILLLSAIITSATVYGVRAAKVRACASNLKSIYTASSLYSGDHDGYLPPYGFFQSQGIPLNVREFKVALGRYGTIRETWFCKLDENAGTSRVGEFISFAETSYTMDLGFFLDAIFNTQSTAMNFDHLKNPAAETAYFIDQPILLETETERIRVTAHRDKVNVVYADGHLKHVPIWQP